jgi:hypothetical protein
MFEKILLCTAVWVIHSFFHQWLHSSLLGRGLLFSSVIIFTETVGLLGLVISPSQGRYLPTGQHKHRINESTNINALSGIRTHDPSFERAKKFHALDGEATVIGAVV